MVKVRLLWMLLLILTLSACARPAPMAEAPAVGVLKEAQVFHPAGPRVVADGLEPVVLTEYPIYVALTFEPGVDQQGVEKGLAVSGPAPVERRWDGTTLTLRLPDGQSGPWSLQLSGVRFRERAAFVQEVRRVRNNRARVTVGDQTMASPEPPSPTAAAWDLSGTFARRLPLKPVTVRVQFEHAVVRKSVEATIAERAADLNLRFDWVSDQEVAIIVPPKLAEARINWTGAKDAEGLSLWTAGYTLQFDGGHQLLGVDPATGKAAVLHTVQLALAGAFLSPDRVHLALVRAAEGTPDQRVFLLDLQTGRLTDTGQAIPVDPMRVDYPLEWPTPDRVKVVARPAIGVSRSLDGRWLAEVKLNEAAEPLENGLIPAFLTVTDLPNEWVAWRVPLALAPAKYGPSMPSLVWSPDSEWLAFADATNSGTAGTLAGRVIRALRLATGEVEELGRHPGPTPSLVGPTGWAPGSEMLAYEGLLVREGKAEVLGMAPSVGGWVDPWSPSGQFVVYGDEQTLTVLDPASGQRTVLGEGILAGWLNDGRALVIGRVVLGR